MKDGPAVSVISICISQDQWTSYLEIYFQAQVADLARLNHENMAKLLGYCTESEPFSRMLVFEYASNGTLFEHLHYGDGYQFSWFRRMKIAIGVAYGLRYLHTELQPPFTIYDLNSSAVYLTEDFFPKCDMMKHFREDLHRRLLSNDFKKQVDGLETLQKALQSSGKEMVELLDILLRWFALQFCESNTTCLLKMLEFLSELIVVLKDEGYSLTEAEATLFFPCFIEKDLMKQIIQIYSASKLLPYILERLHSKNNRSHIECADLVRYFIDHYAEISGQSKCFQVVAGLISERDGELRKAVLNTMASAYKILA